MKNTAQNAKRWFREAENTFGIARRIFETQEAHNAVCFFSEQACQKALKSVLYFDGFRYITIHSISELIKQASEKHPEFMEFLKEGAKLDQYYLSSRYPDAVAEPAIPSEIFTKEQAEEALNTAKKILNCAKKVIEEV